MKAIYVKNPGNKYSLEIREVPKPKPGCGEVLIKVAAAGVNRADIMQAKGLYPPPPGASEILGLEVSGEIVSMGSFVYHHSEGDQVCALLTGGGYAEYVVASEKCLLRIPKGISLIEAASIPEVYFTIWSTLFVKARMRRFQNILIHGGASGIGTAAIQLCHALEHIVFTTAGSDEKCKRCLSLGAAIAINYNNEDFVEVIKKATRGRNVDVILDIIGGDYIQRNLEIAALNGKIINLNYQKGMTATVNFAPMLMKRLSLMANTLRSQTNEEKEFIAYHLLESVWPLFESGQIKPIIDQIYTFSDAQKAHNRLMKAQEHIGKVLLEPSERKSINP